MKNMNAILTELLSMPASGNILAELPEEDRTNAAAICAAMIEAAANGSAEAARFVRDANYENITDRLRGMDLEHRREDALERQSLERERFEFLKAGMEEDPEADPEAGGAEHTAHRRHLPMSSGSGSGRS